VKPVDGALHCCRSRVLCTFHRKWSLLV
jgi:hypothetical protein